MKIDTNELNEQIAQLKTKANADSKHYELIRFVSGKDDAEIELLNKIEAKIGGKKQIRTLCFLLLKKYAEAENIQ